MTRKNLKDIFYILLVISLIFYLEGFIGIKTLLLIMWELLKLINLVFVNLTGDTILTILFKSSITFFLVGLALEIFNIPRGKLGKIFGKVSFWLIGFPVSFVLNFIANIFL